MSNVAATGVPVSAGVERGQSSRPPGHGVPVHVAILTHTSRDDHRGGVGVRDGAGRPEVIIQTVALCRQVFHTPSIENQVESHIDSSILPHYLRCVLAGPAAHQHHPRLRDPGHVVIPR